MDDPTRFLLLWVAFTHQNDENNHTITNHLSNTAYSGAYLKHIFISIDMYMCCF